MNLEELLKQEREKLTDLCKHAERDEWHRTAGRIALLRELINESGNN